MTTEQLSKAQQLHDSIATKKEYLKLLFKMIDNPLPIRQEVKHYGGPGAFFIIPADIVKDEALRQAEELNREIEHLENEFELL